MSELRETIRDRIKSIANDPHIKERYDMYAGMVLGDLREALLSEPVVEAVAKAMCEVDKKSLRHTSDSEYDTDAEWGEVLDKSTHIANEGWSLGRDHYRDLARAALAAMTAGDVAQGWNKASE